MCEDKNVKLIKEIWTKTLDFKITCQLLEKTELRPHCDMCGPDGYDRIVRFEITPLNEPFTDAEGIEYLIQQLKNLRKRQQDDGMEEIDY